MFHIPAWANYSRRRQEGDIFTSYASYREDTYTGNPLTIPINEQTLLLLLRENFAGQLNLTQVRSRASSKEEQKAFERGSYSLVATTGTRQR